MGNRAMKKAALAAEGAGQEAGQEAGHDMDRESKRGRGGGGGARDRRLTANLHLYWYSLKVDREPPAFFKFDPTSIPALWPACLLAVREEGSGAFRLADLGSALANDGPAPARGLAVDAVPEDTLVGRALGCLAGAFSTREAVRLQGRFRHRNSTEMLYRAIGLPFLDVRGGLTYVVCAIGGKAA